MEIVKAEILWTRVCSLKCPYCAMADGRKNSLSIPEWHRGLDELKKLGCGFAAFYGAEPLDDFDKLPSVVGYAESIGIHTTVITSGVTKNFREKIFTLWENGAKSLSMSYDIIPDKKTNRAIPGLREFVSFGEIRDIAAITTLTRKNYMGLISSVKEMFKLGIWTFFDFVHPDRGQPGSKCRNFDGIKDLLFTQHDIIPLLFELNEILDMKNRGFFVHTSKEFIRRVSNNGGQHILNYDWNCARESGFPAWVTVDCDGIVYPCDDFQPKYPYNPIIITEMHERWEEFQQYWQPIVAKQCPGCCWNTHLDAHFIKQGSLPFSDYVHTG